MPPHNLPFMMIGASLLWVGWFGFNVGSNLEANNFAGLVFANTFVCTAAAALAWIVPGVDLQRQADHAGSRLGCHRRPRRDHPGLRRGRSDGRDRPGPDGRPRLPLGGDRASRRRWATTTRWTCSACTASAASWAPSPAPSWATTGLGGYGVFETVGTQLGIQATAVAITLVWSGCGHRRRLHAGQRSRSACVPPRTSSAKAWTPRSTASAPTTDRSERAVPSRAPTRPRQRQLPGPFLLWRLAAVMGVTGGRGPEPRYFAGEHHAQDLSLAIAAFLIAPAAWPPARSIAGRTPTASGTTPTSRSRAPNW